MYIMAIIVENGNGTVTAHDFMILSFPNGNTKKNHNIETSAFVCRGFEFEMFELTRWLRSLV